MIAGVELVKDDVEEAVKAVELDAMGEPVEDVNTSGSGCAPEDDECELNDAIQMVLFLIKLQILQRNQTLSLTNTLTQPNTEPD